MPSVGAAPPPLSGVGAGASDSDAGRRTVFRALNAEDRAALDAQEDILSKGTGGTPAGHVVGNIDGFISASQTLEGASRFESEYGIVEIDVGIATDYGATLVEHPEVIADINQRLDGLRRTEALRNATRAQELLFEGFIPREAILGQR
jgi:hypothetical protein